jgi:uncharacterized membrane protein
MGPGCLPLAIFLILLALLPLAFGQLFTEALLKLRLAPETALLVAIGIIVGSGINLPVKRIVHAEEVVVHPLAVFGMPWLWPSLRRVRRETVIAVNVGGCMIPTALAAYETGYVASEGWAAVGALIVAVLVSTAVCYWIARPVKGIGIAMPGLVPPLVAVTAAMVLAPEQRVPVAFVAGVLGPLIGADLLHLRDISRIATGVASIGGAGTFDGIVLSGIVAAYLA